MLETILYSIGAYLLGSISCALIVCWAFKLPDPRQQGSKNPGATNVLRIGGKLPAALTLAGDMLKGYLAVWLGKMFNLTAFELNCVLFAVFAGHLWPIFFQFKGGKGVATALGGFLALNLAFGLSVIATWFVAAKIFRISSVGAITMAVSAPLYSWYFFVNNSTRLAILLIAAILLLRHKQNILRLIKGKEK